MVSLYDLTVPVRTIIGTNTARYETFANHAQIYIKSLENLMKVLKVCAFHY